MSNYLNTSYNKFKVVAEISILKVEALGPLTTSLVEESLKAVLNKLSAKTLDLSKSWVKYRLKSIPITTSIFSSLLLSSEIMM